MLKSWKARFAAGAGVLLLLLAAGLGWLWAERAALAERVIGQALADRGIAPVSFSVGFIGFRSISLSDIVIGNPDEPDAAASSVSVNYSLGELLSGDVRSVEVGDASLHLAITNSGLSLGALDPLLQGDGGGRLHLPPISVGNAEIVAATPYGDFTFEGPASVLPEGDAIAVSSDALRISELTDEPRFAPLIANGKLLLDGSDLAFTGSVVSHVEDEKQVPLFAVEADYDGEARTGRAVAEGALSFSHDGVTLAALVPALRSLYLDLGGGVAYRLVAEMQGRDLALAMETEFSRFSLNHTAGGSFSLSGRIDAQGGLEGNALMPVHAELHRVTVRDMAAQERFAPIRIEGPLDYAKCRLAADLVIRSALPAVDGARLANVSASYEVDSGRGEVRARGDLSFAPGKLELQTLLPALKGTVARMNGSLAYDARANLQDGNFASSGQARLMDVGFAASAATVEKVNGTVSLSSLLPPRTKGVQSIDVGLLQAGLPLENGTVAFELDRSGLRIVDASWPFAEGKLTLISSNATSSASNAEFLLGVRDVDLSALVALADIPGLRATGHISGDVPIAIRDGDPILLDGNIAAQEEGIIIYRGETAGAVATEQTKLLTDALRNFHYTELAGGLSGNANGELVLRLSLKGANPDLYEGYPFAINVNLEGSLADLLRRGTVGFRPLELIKEQSKGAVTPPANKTEP